MSWKHLSLLGCLVFAIVLILIAGKNYVSPSGEKVIWYFIVALSVLSIAVCIIEYKQKKDDSQKKETGKDINKSILLCEKDKEIAAKNEELEKLNKQISRKKDVFKSFFYFMMFKSFQDKNTTFPFKKDEFDGLMSDFEKFIDVVGNYKEISPKTNPETSPETSPEKEQKQTPESDKQK